MRGVREGDSLCAGPDSWQGQLILRRAIREDPVEWLPATAIRELDDGPRAADQRTRIRNGGYG